MRRAFFLIGLSLIFTNATAWAGLYSGPTDTTNSIDPAVPSTSTRFVEWADAIDPARTYFAPRGSTAISTTGYNSLGDLDASQIAAGQSPGFLTVTFPIGIRNGSGADFAVFENGFTYGSPNGLFMELAYVEVSSNGSDFARFPSISTNTAPVQGSGAFAGYDTSNVHNLAGKHAGGYGTPFDLSDLLSDASVLSGAVDLSGIQYVKLVDIPGNGSFLDSQGHPILDNWLTTGSGGFDFRLPVGQGVGVINTIPEPSSLILLASGVVAAFIVRYRRRKSRHGRWFYLNSQLPHYLSKEIPMRFVASDVLRCLLVFGGLVLATTKATAGIVDFDDLTPTTPYSGPGGGAYWNGSDASGGFTSRGVQFLNNYDSGYSSWNGWSYSNTTDATTAGSANQYSAYTGGAYSGSNYGLYYAPWTPTPTVTAGAPGTFQGMYVTNTTYAALSMLNGDPFAKKFGGLSGNDPDWFLLNITGRDASGAATGTVDFYLADYRFADKASDYIVDDWTLVDLTSLGDSVKSLEFALSSSDVGQWGMNTPAYCAMDNLTIVPEPSMLALLCAVGVAGTVWRYKQRWNAKRDNTLTIAGQTVNVTRPTKCSVWLRLLFLTVIVVVAAFVRLIPHPPNFGPMGAIALFGGAFFPRTRNAFLVPLAALLLSDLMLGLHALVPVVYGCLALNVLLGRWLRSRCRFLPIALATVAGAVQFFVITNFACWVFWYPHTLEGFFACYLAAIPFFHNTLIGDAVFTTVLFGGLAVAEGAAPILREECQTAHACA